MKSDRAALRAEAEASVSAMAERIGGLVLAIGADPELSFEEHRAVDRIAEVLGEAGHPLRTGSYGLETAFEAEAGEAPLTVVVCAEYDALPGVGHGCGHNVIAGASVGAYLAVAPLAERLGIRLVLLGTPAEEHGTGKSLLLEAGAWDRATVSMMVHPTHTRDRWPDATPRIAVHRLTATFRGRAAHAASGPELGVNAADAATITLVALGLLRQQVADGMRLNAVIREAGRVTNIIPDIAIVDFEVRGPERASQQLLEQRVLACFEGAALATGCTWEYEEAEPLYEDLRQDPELVELFGRNLLEVGRKVDRTLPAVRGGSTDMGNVSHYLPSIHPTIWVRGSHGPMHSETFAAAAQTPEAIVAALDAAKAMALTIIDFATDAGLRESALAAQAERPPYAVWAANRR